MPSQIFHMSKLRVGDIEIDDSSVRLAGQPVTAGLAGVGSVSSPMQPPIGALAALRRIPVSSRTIGWIGSTLVIAGLVSAFLGEAWANPLGALVRGGFMVPLGASLIGASVLKTLLDNGSVHPERIALGDSAEEMVRRSRDLLRNPLRHQTVEWVAQRTGWSETTVVRILALMRARGELAEELDTDTGEFFYHTVRRQSQDLDSRLDHINNGRTS